MWVRASWVLLVAVVSLAWSCTSLPAPPSGQCRTDSDCSDGQVCADLYCRARCRADSDCPSGQRCVATDRPDVLTCQAPMLNGRCSRTSDCPDGLFCIDTTCRAQCQRDYDCAVVNPFFSCVSNACRLVCPTGFADCDGDPRNGCEVDTRGDVAHCGACETACPTPPDGVASCVAGRCASTCRGGYGDCDGDTGNGCEARLDAPDHCGACATRCAAPTPLCSRTVAAPGQPAVYACVAACPSETQTRCGESCVDTRADLNHCGACGNRCQSGPNATAACDDGVCRLTCMTEAPVADCDGVATNGCEATLTTDRGNCGACGASCADAPNGAGACRDRACVLTCNESFGDCDGDRANGCESDLRVTAEHCGACGTACPARANAVVTCTGGACGSTCAPGFADCDGNAANGCETNLQSDTEHCGACATRCMFPGSGARCAMGRCEATACVDPGTGDCDGNTVNGCETDLRATVAHCGACGSACSLANAAPACVTSRCAVAACNTGFGDCDAMPTNGCETDLTSTASSCGMCGRACSLAHATAACRGGACAVAACATGFGDCDGAATNGCETDLATTATACGACGRACSLPHATAACRAGACAVGACATGWGDCDGMAANGCETPLDTSAHCGTCTTTCPTGTLCSGTTCSSVCIAPTTFCAGACVTTATDVRHCGACGNACPTPANATATCASSRCGYVCNPGFGDCDGNAANGCETNLNTTVASCGACGRACVVANATASCAAGVCGVAMCNAGYGDCNMSAADGCETNLNTTVTSCGTCGRLCSLANATSVCTAGACAVGTCNAGFSDCDRVATNGCETNTNTTVTSCGACGRACTFANGVAACVGGGCRLASCNAGFADCDGVATNGCETALTAVGNCGACGRVCTPPRLGTPTCVGMVCGFTCAAGYYVNGASCSPVPPPRLVSPMSLTTSSTRHPVFRVALTAPADGTRVQLCRDRGCTSIVGTADGASTVTWPTDLAPGTYYWRAFGRIGTNVGVFSSFRTWELFVPNRNAARNTAFGTVLDVNGDGYADAAVGEGGYARVYIYFGSATGLAATPSQTLSGPSGFGATVASAGDMNGDGFGDLIVGSPTTYQFSVFLGGATGLATTGTARTGAIRMGFGSHVAGAGDVDADGYADVVIGGCGGSCGNNAFVFYGAATLDFTTRVTTLTAPAGVTTFGYDVAGLGEVNNDDYDDIMVTDLTGTVAVYQGSAAGITNTITRTLRPTNFHDAGYGGDINGDGYADLLVGTHTMLVTGAQAGVVTAYPGGAAGIGASSTLGGQDTTARIGNRVQGVGDLNADGFDDVVSADLATIGRVFQGSSSALTLGARLTGAGLNFGVGAATLGDVDGNGYWDIVLGAPDDLDTTCQGAAYFWYFTAAGAPLRYSAIRRNTDMMCWGQYGAAVASRAVRHPRGAWWAVGPRAARSL